MQAKVTRSPPNAVPPRSRCKRRSTATAAHAQDPSAATHPRLSWVGTATELVYELGMNSCCQALVCQVCSEPREQESLHDVPGGARPDGGHFAEVPPLAFHSRRLLHNLQAHERLHARRPRRDQFLLRFGGDRVQNAPDNVLRHIVLKRDPPDDLLLGQLLRLGPFHRPPWTLFHGRGHGRGRGRD